MKKSTQRFKYCSQIVILFVLLFLANPVKASDSAFNVIDLDEAEIEELVIDEGIVKIILDNGATFNIGFLDSTYQSIIYYTADTENCIDKNQPSLKLNGANTSEYYLKFNNNPCTTGSSGGGGGGSSSGGGGSSITYASPVTQEQAVETSEQTETTIEQVVTVSEKVVSPQPQLSRVNTVAPKDRRLKQISNESAVILKKGVSFYNIIKSSGIDAKKEGMKKYTQAIVSDVALAADAVESINNFIVYGTKSTNVLGAGERAGVINSYKTAFETLPTTQEGWEDVLKISNGRWPSQRSEVAEAKGAVEFEKIYKRKPDADNERDEAALVLMAYGLRPAERNLESEKVAINIFRNIYKINPTEAADWDIVRAIAYSGASR